MVKILSSASGTGIWSTTAGAYGTIASTGPFSPQSRVKLSYSFAASSGEFAGIEPLFRGNFAQSVAFPGDYLRIELLDPADYTVLNVEVVESA